MRLRLFLIITSCITLQAEEDEILKILNKATRVHTPKYPDYKIYDPFQKTAPAIKRAKEIKITPTPPLPKLKAIINSSAYINGKWRRVGEDINGYKVVSIGDEWVVLALGDRNITIYITPKQSKDDFIEIVEPKTRR